MDLEHNKENIFGFGFATAALRTFSVLLFTQISYLLVSIITARALGPAGKGALAVLILYPTVLFMLGHLSIYRSLTISVAEKRYSFSDFPGSVLTYILFVSISLIAIFILVYFNFPKFFIQGINMAWILLSLSMLPLFLINQTFSSLLEVTGNIPKLNFKDVANAILLLFFIVISLGIFKKGVEGALISYGVTNALITVLVVYFVRKISPDKWRFNFSLLKSLMKGGLKLHASLVTQFIISRVDMFILAYYRQTASTGYYSIAVSIGELLGLISVAIQMAFYSKLSYMFKDKLEITKKTIVVYRHGLVIFTAAAIFLLTISRTAILIFYGRGFLPSLKPFLILLPGMFILYLNSILVIYLISMKRFLTVAIIFSVSSILNLILNVILIPRYDTMGAALSSSITRLIQGTFIFIIFMFISKYSPKQFFKEIRIKKDDIIIYQIFFKNFINRLKSKLLTKSI